MSGVRLDYLPRTYGTAICTRCGKQFVAHRAQQKYCSRQCYLTHRWSRRNPTIKCIQCQEPFRPRTGLHRFCRKKCAHAYRRAHAPRRNGHPCAGEDCKKWIRGKTPRCASCQADFQAQRVLEAQPLAPGPKVCTIPTRGGWCGQALLFQVNRAGQTVSYCAVHGERVERVIRPGDADYPTVTEEAA